MHSETTRPWQAALLTALFSTAAIAASSLSVSPTAIPIDEPGEVQLDVAGLLGAEVVLRLYVDIDGDGTIDPEDQPIWTDVITDNLAEWSPNMFSDSDPVTGAVTVDLRLFGPVGFPYSAGNFIWEAEDSFDGSTGLASFTVTQPSQSQSVSGTVINAATLLPEPGALVLLEPFCDGGEETKHFYSTFADENGAYTIALPAELDCNHRLAIAVKPGFLTGLLGQPHLVFGGSDNYTGQDLSLTPGSRPVTGRVAYENGPRSGEGVTGVAIFVESFDGPPVFTVAFTDESGAFELMLDDGEWGMESPEEGTEEQGAVAREDAGLEFEVAGTPVALPDLTLPAANAFFQGVLTDDAGSPQGAHWVSVNSQWPCDPDCYRNETLTRADGSFTLSVAAPAAPSSLEFMLSTPDPLPGLVAEQRGCESISDGQTLTDRNLQHLAPTGFVEGTIEDKSGDALENICMQAWGSSQACGGYQSAAVSSCDGSYALPVVDGDWNVHVEVDDLAAVYRNLDDVEVDRNLQVAGAALQPVDFIIGGWSYSPTVNRIGPISGPAGTHVLVEGAGFSFASPPEVQFGGVPATMLDFRPELGAIVVEVPAGLPPGDNAVTVYNPDLGQTSNEYCFEALAGAHTPACTIDGRAIELQSFFDVPDALVVILADEGERFVRADVTDSNGDWSVGLDAPGDYTVILIPPQGQPWSWGQYPTVACGTTVNHAFVGGSHVTGRVVSDTGDGVSNATVETESDGGYYAFTVTDEDGWFELFVPGGNYEFFFEAPAGSRFVAPLSVQQLVGGNVDLGQVTMDRGFYFSGVIEDANREGLAAEVDAFRRDDGGWAGSSDSNACSGRFDLALRAGEYRLNIRPDELDVDGPTRVKWIVISGDTTADFDFVVYDRNALQLDPTEPRIAFVEQGSAAQLGQPLQLSIENADGQTVDVLFTDGAGGFVPGDATGWDPARGMVVTRVPALAKSGGMRLRVDGVDGPSAPFTLLPGSFPAGAHDVSGVVTGPLGVPLEGTFVALMWRDPLDPDCDEDDGLFVDYGVTDPAGAYGPLAHPGGDFFVAFLPPAGAGLLVAADQRAGVFTDTTIDATLLVGLPIQLRVTDDAPIPAPVPNAIFEAESDGGWDWRMTDASGDVTLYVAPGDYGFALIPPAGSRLIEQEWDETVNAGLDYGDRAMVRGSMVGSAVADAADGSPISDALIEAFGADSPWEFFFEASSDFDGTFRGPISPGSTFQLFIESPSDALTDIHLGGLFGQPQDFIRYPAHQLGPAGFVDGFVRDALSSAPLADIELSSSENDNGAPGDWNGWTRSCPDGRYRLKLAAGTHFLQANGYAGNGYAEKWYPDAYCGQAAAPLTVTAGDTTTIDVELDLLGSVSGVAWLYDGPLEGAGVCASSAELGGCQFCNASTDPGGSYSLALPQAADYRVEAYAPGLGNQCFASEDGCADFVPVPVAGGADTPNVDFQFGCPSGIDVLNEQMEAGAPGWSADGLWHLATEPSCTPASRSGAAYHYGTGACDYDTGVANSGTLYSPLLTNVPAGVSLSFWERRDTDGNCFVTDRSQVLLRVNGAPPIEIWEECDNSNRWLAQLLDLTPYYTPGDTLQVGFRFDSVDAANNQFQGWMIDDVRLRSCDPDAPGEPSGAAALEPLRMSAADGNAIVVEQAPGATAYNVYIDQLGSYYSPAVGDGTACTVTDWTDNGDGTLTLDVFVPPGSWVVVSASNRGGESTVGLDSSGIDRGSVGSWESCPLGP